MVLVREMTTSDIRRVSELMCSCYQWLGCKNGFSDSQLDFLVSERGSVNRITVDFRTQVYLVACKGDLIVGVIAINGNEVTKLFVVPSCHGQGIGTKLFNSAQQIIANDGHEEMTVGVMACSAIDFYKRKGMTKYREKRLDAGAFKGCKVPMMKKSLTNEENIHNGRLGN